MIGGILNEPLVSVGKKPLRIGRLNEQLILLGVVKGPLAGHYAETATN